MLVHVDVKGMGPPMKGDVAMVSGRVMLTRGLDLPRGAEIDVLDGPVLMLRVVMNTLGRIYPAGPDSVSGENKIDKKFELGMHYATPSAEGYIPPPWRVVGKVSRKSDGAYSYDLAITAPAGEGGKAMTMKLAGEISALRHAVFDDATSIADWKVYGVGVQVEQQGKSTTYDYGARADATASYKTIGDIRGYVQRKIAEEQYPGVKDATKDFTGFWKGNCDEPFGLKVEHGGSEGKYAVVFCGPGGCGDAREERLTFITGDKKHYEVVNDDEFVHAGTNYRRCSRDPNVKLEYKQSPAKR
jgi:hypothetical protein